MDGFIGLYDCVSPLDFRYYGGNKRLVKEISPYFSENAKVRYQARVEAEYAKALAAKKVIPKKAAENIVSAALRVKPADVYREEERIRHDIKALVNCICANLGEKEKPYVHLGLTSYDVVDTANALRFKEGTEKIILPKLKKLEKALIKLALREKNTLQIGRTHGQFAEPITFGFAIAEFVERLGERIEAIEKAKDALAGKASGAVGASNALSLVCRDPEAVEAELMKRLGLKTARVSTQIAPREQMLDLEHAVVSCFGVIANLADDLRHLQRSEISEVAESFGKEQVGSSTMPQKRNPVTFENIKSLWKEFMPRTITLYMDQISEHQRDLTNSASARFYQETFVALAVAAEKMEGAVSSLKVDRAKMRENFEKAKGSLTAEPLYVLLAKHGHPNAHETARAIAAKAKERNSTVLAEAGKADALASFIAKFSKSEKRLLERPELYTGIAAKKTAKTCAYWKKKSRL
ncbi:MAG: lyase family protein [Candidatus Diapherotrites archaeon]|nr:lyase family protein [Candidatus Diapherotrites archaeon]